MILTKVKKILQWHSCIHFPSPQKRLPRSHPKRCPEVHILYIARNPPSVWPVPHTQKRTGRAIRSWPGMAKMCNSSLQTFMAFMRRSSSAVGTCAEVCSLSSRKLRDSYLESWSIRFTTTTANHSTYDRTRHPSKALEAEPFSGHTTGTSMSQRRASSLARLARS